MLLAAGLGLLPVYAGPSGRPQPAHIVLFLAAIVVLLKQGSQELPVAAPKVIVTAVGLSLWVFLVQVFWSLRGADLTMTVPLQFLFNTVVLFGLINGLTYFRSARKGLEAGIYLALIVAIGYAGAHVALDDMSSGRFRGPANNPNQYAYIIVCMWASLLLIRRGKSRARDAAIGTLVVLAVILTASLAGVFAVALVTLSLVVPRIVAATASHRKRNLAAGASLTMLAAAQVVDFAPRWEFIVSRWDRKAPAYVEERRLLLTSGDPLQPLIGAGKGDLGRFSDRTNEIHNTYVDLYFSFGVMGILLFAVILILIARGIDVAQAMIVIGVLTYGLSHVGYRTPAFWVFLAVLWHSNASRWSRPGMSWRFDAGRSRPSRRTGHKTHNSVRR